MKIAEKKYLIYTRENKEKHPIVKNVLALSSVSGYAKARFFNAANLNKPTIIFNPLDLLYLKKRPSVYFCMEMVEYQVKNTSLRNIVRNAIYAIFQRLCFVLSKQVVFPNQLRAKHYFKRLKSLERKSEIIPNYPSVEIIRSIKSQVEPFERLGEIFFAGLLNDKNRGLSLLNLLAEKEIKVNVAGRVASGILSPRINYIGVISQKEAVAMMRKYEFAFLYYDNSNLNTRYSASVKIFEYYIAGCKILSNRNPGILEFRHLVYGFLEEDGSITINEDYKADLDIPSYESIASRYL